MPMPTKPVDCNLYLAATFDAFGKRHRGAGIEQIVMPDLPAVFVYTDPATGDVWVHGGEGHVWKNLTEESRARGDNEVKVPEGAIQLVRLKGKTFTEDKDMDYKQQGLPINLAQEACELTEAFRDHFFNQTASRLLASIMQGWTHADDKDLDRVIGIAVSGARKLCERLAVK